MTRAHAAQRYDRSVRLPCNRREPRRAEKRRAGVGTRCEQRRDKHHIRTRGMGRSQLPEVMNRRTVHPSPVPACGRSAMVTVRSPLQSQIRLTREQYLAMPPPRRLLDPLEKSMPITRTQPVMPQHDGRSMRKARNRPHQISLCHAFVAHQPHRRNRLTQFTLASTHGASYSGANEPA